MKKLFLSLATALLIALPFALVAPSQNAAALFDSSKKDACAGIGGSAAGGDCVVAGGKTVQGIITNVVNVLSIAVGIIAVVMIIVAGAKYITSSGDANAIASAKTTLIWAVAGLIVVALAQGIVQFVINKVNGAA
jgi:hypothetical protein